MNFPKWFTIPIKRCKSFTFRGGGNSDMAFVFVGSACIPCSSMMVPRNFTEVLKNWHFSMLRVIPASCRQCCVALSHLSCSFWLALNVIHLAYYPINIFKAFRHCRLENPWDRTYAKRKAVKTSVVSSFDSSSRGSCQNPLLASSLVK